VLNVNLKLLVFQTSFHSKYCSCRAWQFSNSSSSSFVPPRTAVCYQPFSTNKKPASVAQSVKRCVIIYKPGFESWQDFTNN